jgi:hypothetical protein
MRSWPDRWPHWLRRGIPSLLLTIWATLPFRWVPVASQDNFEGGGPASALHNRVHLGSTGTESRAEGAARVPFFANIAVAQNCVLAAELRLVSFSLRMLQPPAISRGRRMGSNTPIAHAPRNHPPQMSALGHSRTLRRGSGTSAGAPNQIRYRAEAIWKLTGA